MPDSSLNDPATMYPDRCPRCYTTSRDWVRYPYRVTDDSPGFVRADYRCDRHLQLEEWSCWWARQTVEP